jgi:hypothetical protein
VTRDLVVLLVVRGVAMAIARGISALSTKFSDEEPSTLVQSDTADWTDTFRALRCRIAEPIQKNLARSTLTQSRMM